MAALRPSSLILFVLCGSLSALLMRQIFGPEKQYPVPAISRSPPLPNLPRIPAFSPPLAETLVELNGRPLFNPKRQQIDPFVETKLAPPPPAFQVTFIGTISQDGKQLAMVKTPGTPLAYTVQVGSMLEGWKISEIAPERILLVTESATSEVKLNSAPPPPRPVVANNNARNPGVSLRSRGNITQTAAIPNIPPRPPQPAPLPDQRAHLRGIQ